MSAGGHSEDSGRPHPAAASAACAAAPAAAVLEGLVTPHQVIGVQGDEFRSLLLGVEANQWPCFWLHPGVRKVSVSALVQGHSGAPMLTQAS